MKLTIATMFVVVVALFGVLVVPAAAADPPTRQEVEQRMGLRSQGDLVRGQRGIEQASGTAILGEPRLPCVGRFEDRPDVADSPADLVANELHGIEHLLGTAILGEPRLPAIGCF